MRLDPSDCALVFAHPDDEVLWASSILVRAARVILCFGEVAGRPELSAGRRAAVGRLPLTAVDSLDLPETGAFGLADWPDPEPTPLGLAIRGRGGPRARVAAAAYAGNFVRLVEELRPRLQGVGAVVTHNPWGEYGHEEHVQVFRAVEALQPELGFALWVSGYVSEKSAALMRGCLGGLGATTPPLPTDPGLGARMQAIYDAANCWTWFDDYVWPDTETFHRWEPGRRAARPGETRAMCVIRMDWTPPPPRPSALRRIGRRLGVGRAPARRGAA